MIVFIWYFGKANYSDGEQIWQGLRVDREFDHKKVTQGKVLVGYLTVQYLGCGGGSMIPCICHSA